MTSTIWGAFGMTLLLVVAVAAMIQYIKDREKSKNTKGDEWNKVVGVKPKEPDAVRALDISEPVTSFIKCFKENPKRFKIVNGNYLRDTTTNIAYIFMATTRYRDGKVLPHLHNIDKRLQWLTDEECEALVAVMYPYFVTKRRERLHSIQRQRLTRIYKEKPNV